MVSSGSGLHFPGMVRVTANQYKAIRKGHPYPMMKYFNSDGRGVFQDDNDDIPSTRYEGSQDGSMSMNMMRIMSTGLCGRN